MLANSLTISVLVSTIGWRTIIPLLTSLVYLAAHKRNKQPHLGHTIFSLIHNMRTIKFYGWEEAFRQVADDDQVDKFISAALTVSSFLHTSNNIEYADILLVMSSAESLTEMLLRKDDYQFIACRNDADDVAVSMDCCSFQWNTGDFALKNMDLRISKGEFAVVVGRMAPGLVSGKIGYVSQKPWIMNATVRDNFYHTVLDACALAEDIKLRLALARAIYSRADIFVLDDLLAAVDAHWQTRILVTHAEHVVPLADRVVTLVSGCATVAKQFSDDSSAGSGQFTYDPERGVDTHIWPKLWQYIVFCGFSAVADWPTTGTIEFRDYSMRYRESQDLQEKIGVVGRTGAGNPDSGAIFIDGVDISSIGLKHLRSKISIIPQDPALFNGTIRENLDPLNEFTDDEVWGAIHKGCIDDIVSTPTETYGAGDNNSGPWVEGIGLNKWIEDGGRNFSVGQRQLVSLCRALLWKRKILVLDEATANRVIHEEFKDCTVLTIAHRLRTVMDSDRILVMDQGRVAEFDSPANLLAQDTMFKGLVESMELNESKSFENPPCRDTKNSIHAILAIRIVWYRDKYIF
ncbi:P-loop containing nucleoside triphosphate hydrolase protein [Linderina pennispora]|uniref:p-loop containing nucleoside triphosphate hydrolase protein n=1 Tax=Linderina pennispora TaxID=61395 RepID=A0A1Y1VRL8_9FUNG|nr:P-loop containing nucleoside triphosphate hydrolase protein [Linderina pennispora]ORX63907.1 P-loop containing nucleoside triphosphate hydrolase protein [Linderina pennispora]